MPTPEMSDATTKGVRVGATAYYLPEESDPESNKYLFGYTIVVANTGEAPVRLVSRHWVIIDGKGNREEVQGPGVVGKTPRLEPGQAFKYQSFCPLPTPWGTMEGTYQMERDDGETFDANIGRFYLAVPRESEQKPERKPARPNAGRKPRG
ncbi:MAG TPA: Co2+/Mg2+ efflux protein ApaG [Tepidisphaeraceae bacterium]|nr:Co2+/Mg2+ efflux protein ApaG [Tepidisphaeraceae bacterium]